MNTKLKYGCMFFVASCLLFSCGKKNETPQDKQDATETSQTKGPRPADNELVRCDTARLGGHTYILSIHRKADETLPTVTDPLEQVFYDNCVEVNITRDGDAFFQKTFRKEAFSGFLSNADRESGILLGMAYDELSSSAGHLCLAAQIGQPGTGEGPAFTVDIPLNGGAYSIVRDTRQDTTNEDQEGV